MVGGDSIADSENANINADDLSVGTDTMGPPAGIGLSLAGPEHQGSGAPKHQGTEAKAAVLHPP